MARKRKADPIRAQHRREMGMRLRVARGRFTPKEIAEHLGVQVNTYLGYERGRVSMPLHLVLPFCQKTHFRPGFIVTGLPPDDLDDGTETANMPRPELPKSNSTDP